MRAAMKPTKGIGRLGWPGRGLSYGEAAVCQACIYGCGHMETKRLAALTSWSRGCELW